MDDIILLTLVALLLLILTLIVYYLNRDKTTKVRQPVQREQGQNLRRLQARNQRARLRANVAARIHDSDDEHHDNENDAADEEEKRDSLDFDDKIGAKKRAKLEAKAEKKAAREAELKIREERKKKEAAIEEERRKLEERERAEEIKREEQFRKAKEEKEQREHEEYMAMKAAFSVEEEGFEDDEDGNENTLQEFINYIKNNKVVVLEDIAAHFKLKTQAVIDRITDLKKDGLITGVIDDRGKFIYISQKELDAVAKFIRQRGRVSICELAEHSNNLISLEPAKC